MKWATGMAVMLAPLAVGLTSAVAGDRDRDHYRPDTLPDHFSGLLNDHGPSAALVAGGPYEMRAKWSLDVDERHGTARFSAAMDMQKSDFGITQGTVNKDDPATRGAHTHHISMTDGVVTLDWPARCPALAPPATEGFAITGNAFVTSNGVGVPFGNPSPVTICILGGANVKYSNITLTFGPPSTVHFGTQPIHGVVLRCSGRSPRASNDCTLDE
jgi:hypothetical protein